MKHPKGFTIIEMLVVVSIIGIIAALSYVFWSTARGNAVAASLKADVTNAAHTIEGEFALTNSISYFTSLSQYNNGSGIVPSSGNTFVYTVNNNSKPVAFCISAYNGTTSYMASSTNKNATLGSCGTTGLVTTGLVLHLDAGEATSYPASGTTWYDLSGSGNNATMYGSVPFSTDTVPMFDFATVSGASAYLASLGFTFNSNMVATTGDFSFSTWIKNPPASGAVGLFANAGSADGYRFGPHTTGAYWLIGPTYKESTLLFGTTLNSGIWYNVVVVFSRTSNSISTYLNGVFKANDTFPSPQTAFTSYVPGLVRSGCCSLYTGKLSTFSVYNKALTASEIASNYSWTKARYGN